MAPAIALIVIVGCGDQSKKAVSGGAAATAGSVGACATSKPEGEARDLDVALCLADAPSAAVRAAQEHPVELYLDKSASIQGFLDPEYPTHIPTDFRSVIDRLVVGVRPVRTFGYGEGLHEAKPDLGVVGQKEFYSDRDTRMEDALRQIATDTSLSANHLIVGDARRGSPASANTQFTAMRELAVKWVQQGGTFAVGSSLAPFKTVESDPSGCRRGEASATPQTCPLYAFAFIAQGDELRMLGTLGGVFENLYAWPMVPIAGASLVVAAQGGPGDVMLEPIWQKASDGAPIVRTRGTKASNAGATAAVRIADSTSVAGATFHKLFVGEGFRTSLSAKSLDLSAKQREWLPVGQGASVIRTMEQPATVSIVTRGPTSAKSIVKLDVSPTGEPTWLSSFDAADAKDVLRTYGLGRLFESFRQSAATGAKSVGHVYFVVN